MKGLALDSTALRLSEGQLERQIKSISDADFRTILTRQITVSPQSTQKMPH